MVAPVVLGALRLAPRIIPIVGKVAKSLFVGRTLGTTALKTASTIGAGSFLVEDIRRGGRFLRTAGREIRAGGKRTRQIVGERLLGEPSTPKALREGTQVGSGIGGGILTIRGGKIVEEPRGKQIDLTPIITGAAGAVVGAVAGAATAKKKKSPPEEVGLVGQLPTQASQLPTPITGTIPTTPTQAENGKILKAEPPMVRVTSSPKISITNVLQG